MAKAAKRVWFPMNVPWTLKTALMRLNAKLLRGRMVWVRNHRDKVILTVAYRLKERDSDGRPVHVAYYFWPWFRKITLHDDGTVTMMDGRSSYVRHWIETSHGAQCAQMLQNADVYKRPLL